MAEMTNLEKLAALIDVDTSDTTEMTLLEIYLSFAESKVLNRLYPFGFDEGTEIPPKYNHKVLEIAQYLYERRGSEGEISHSENGIARSYEDADVPSSMLFEITPMVGVV